MPCLQAGIKTALMACDPACRLAREMLAAKKLASAREEQEERWKQHSALARYRRQFSADSEVGALDAAFQQPNKHRKQRCIQRHTYLFESLSAPPGQLRCCYLAAHVANIGMSLVHSG